MCAIPENSQPSRFILTWRHIGPVECRRRGLILHPATGNIYQSVCDRWLRHIRWRSIYCCIMLAGLHAAMLFCLSLICRCWYCQRLLSLLSLCSKHSSVRKATHVHRILAYLHIEVGYPSMQSTEYEVHCQSEKPLGPACFQAVAVGVARRLCTRTANGERNVDLHPAAPRSIGDSMEHTQCRQWRASIQLCPCLAKLHGQFLFASLTTCLPSSVLKLLRAILVSPNIPFPLEACSATTPLSSTPRLLYTKHSLASSVIVNPTSTLPPLPWPSDFGLHHLHALK